MNIEDTKIDWELYKGRDLLDVLFEKQDELRVLYKVPVCDLDIPTDQQQLRAMAWNVTEEGAEALFAAHHPEHLGDEIADMTAFYIELLLMSGLTWTDFYNAEKDWKINPGLNTHHQYTMFISQLAIAVNTLKNRYWRKTNVKTDKLNYHERLKETFGYFKLFVQSFGITFEQLMDYYLRKHEVNLFRIRSKY